MLFSWFHQLNYWEKITLTKRVPKDSLFYTTGGEENGWSNRKNPH